MKPMKIRPPGWYRKLGEHRKHAYWDGEAWGADSEEEAPLAALRLSGRSDIEVCLVFEMSNQRRGLKAVERLRQAGHHRAAIENRRAGDIEVFLDVTVREAARDEVVWLVLDVDPESRQVAAP